MPVRRLEEPEKRLALDFGSKHFKVQARNPAQVVGYLYGDPAAREWDGYITIRGIKQTIHATYEDDGMGDEYMEISFDVTTWDAPTPVRIDRKGAKTFGGEILFPQSFWTSESSSFYSFRLNDPQRKFRNCKPYAFDIVKRSQGSRGRPPKPW